VVHAAFAATALCENKSFRFWEMWILIVKEILTAAGLTSKKQSADKETALT
jgi:hypothetical protein